MWYLTVFLICIFLITKALSIIFMCLLARTTLFYETVLEDLKTKKSVDHGSEPKPS